MINPKKGSWYKVFAKQSEEGMEVRKRAAGEEENG
jgi:hypothetical protein